MPCYCNHPSVNLLTELLARRGVRDVVLCPGSRNAVLVHNFTIDGRFRCHPVTDERSAAFVALGLAIATRKPVIVCVTSGSAVYNLAPAAAEAAQRHVPLLLLTADRPPQWVGQQDGQTLCQPGAFQALGIRSFQLPEGEENAAWCNRLANEALLLAERHGGTPVHFNLPLSEPLFSFHSPRLSPQRLISRWTPEAPTPLPDALLTRIEQARLPLLFVGQTNVPLPPLNHLENNDSLLVLPDLLAGMAHSRRTARLEMAPLLDSLRPDLILHVGGNTTHKRLRLHLRHHCQAPVVRIGIDEAPVDTFGRIDTWVEANPQLALQQLDLALRISKPAVAQWKQRLDSPLPPLAMPFSDLAATRLLLHELPVSFTLHVANSKPIRHVAALWDEAQMVYANRGVNGIEGCLSTAVGHALAGKGPVVCLIGDLAFFYDANALWNTRLPSGLRVVVFNNGHGQIFCGLPGLADSPALEPYVAGDHHTSARGLAEAYGLSYLRADDEAQLTQALPQLYAPESPRPVLLEIFTRSAANEAAWQAYRHHLEALA